LFYFKFYVHLKYKPKESKKNLYKIAYNWFKVFKFHYLSKHKHTRKPQLYYEQSTGSFFYLLKAKNIFVWKKQISFDLTAQQHNILRETKLNPASKVLNKLVSI